MLSKQSGKLIVLRLIISLILIVVQSFSTQILSGLSTEIKPEAYVVETTLCGVYIKEERSTSEEIPIYQLLQRNQIKLEDFIAVYFPNSPPSSQIYFDRISDYYKKECKNNNKVDNKVFDPYDASRLSSALRLTGSNTTIHIKNVHSEYSLSCTPQPPRTPRAITSSTPQIILGDWSEHCRK